MKVSVFESYQGLSEEVAQAMVQLIVDKPDCSMCLSAGDTPRLAYSLFADKTKRQRIDISHCTFFSLDEWVGISKDNPGSCSYFLHQYVFDPLNINREQYFVFDSQAKDLLKECSVMDDAIRSRNGIDLMIVGVGMNGHIGFNEPGVSFHLYTHVNDLDATTQSVGQKYFQKETSLQRGITLGLQHLLESRKVILMANGAKKANILKEALEGDISSRVPASIMRNHPQGYIMIDREAASRLSPHLMRV